MVTDNQRREVAARIRELMSECFFLPLFVVIAQAINDCLPEEEGAYALILADLIDRPKCSMECKMAKQGRQVMTSDEKRREVARELRKLTAPGCIRYAEEFYEELREIVALDLDGSFEGVAGSLADLIDPEGENDDDR